MHIHLKSQSIAHILYNLFAYFSDLTSSQGIKPSQRWSYSKVMGRAKVLSKTWWSFYSIWWIFSFWKFLEKTSRVVGIGPPPSPSSLTMPDSGAQRLSVIPTERLSRHHTCCMRGPSEPHLLQELFWWSGSHQFLLIELHSLQLTCQLYVNLKSRLMA
jgi:hypothetical protein